MPVAIDTSILIAAEKEGDFERLLPVDEEGPYYIPAHAAAEFLVGTHPPVRADLRQRAARIYAEQFKSLVSPFTERDATQLAALLAHLKRQGQQMKWFDAGIAATALARRDKLLTADGDFDRLSDRLTLLKP
jgi:predicted nucleic acid-binding protein